MKTSRMEEIQPKARKASVTFILLVSFLLGSFSGAAFGVLFALSLNEEQFPWRTVEAVPGSIVQERLVSAEDASVIQAARKVSPSVVSIVVSKDVAKLYGQTGPLFFEDFFGFGLPVPIPAPAPEGGQEKRQIGGGTGFVISEDGLILTNRHVVLDEEAEYEAVMADGKTYPARVLARDVLLDVAVLKIEATGLPVAELGNSGALQIGETVIAIGNALSEYRNTVTKGVVSGINRRVVAGDGMGSSEVLEEAIQTDAAINPGNSGGPLIDLRGTVVGVNTAVNRSGQSIGFAIPIDAVKPVIESVRTQGRIIRPWLGVRYVPVTPAIAKANGLAVDHGALIAAGGRGDEAGVVPGSPAASAGIKEGDVLLSVDGERIDEAHPLSGLIAKRKAGDAVAIALLRGGAERTVTVTLGELPADLP